MEASVLSRPSFTNPEGTDFLRTLKISVEEFFKARKIKKQGNKALYIKAAIFLSSLAGLFTVLVFFTPSSFIFRFFLWVLLGLNLAFIGFNVMHDACHGSFSSKKGVNTGFGLSLNVMGGYDEWWKQKHNIIHHTYTNVDPVDEDIAIPFMRVHPNQRWRWFHRYQHHYWYWCTMYGLTYFAWILISDFKRYFTSKVRGNKFKISLWNRFRFWLSKAMYGTFAVFIPIKMCSWQIWLEGFLISGIVCGFTIAVIFQLAHEVEDTEKPTFLGEIMPDEWAIHQVKTTANFSTRSKLLGFLCGGLNFQIEHHLFPRVSHVHYPDLQPLVKKHCALYCLPYNEKPMFPAIRSHISVLKQLGEKPKELEKKVA